MRIGTSLVATALVAAALGLLVGLPATARAEPRAAVATTVAAMRGENLILVSLRLGRHWDGPEGPTLKLVSAVHPIVITSELEAGAKVYGVQVGQVTELVVGISPMEGFVATTTLIDEQAADKFDASMTPTDGTETIGGRKFVTNSKSGFLKERLDPRVVQFGPTVALRSFFGSERAKVAQDVADGFLAAAAKANILTLDLSPAFLKGSVPVAETPYAPLFEAKRWRVTVHADKRLTIVLRSEFAAEAEAKAGAESLAACLTGLDKILEMGQEKMPEVFQRKLAQYPRGPEVEPIMNRAFQDIRKALAVTKPTVVGNVAEATIEIETDRPVTTAVMLFTMVPRPQENPGAPAQPADQPKTAK